MSRVGLENKKLELRQPAVESGVGHEICNLIAEGRNSTYTAEYI